MDLRKKLHDQVRDFLQAKNKLITVRIWSPNSIWLPCGGCVYIGSQIEILSYNCQKMICIEGLDNKLTHFRIDLIISAVNIKILITELLVPWEYGGPGYGLPNLYNADKSFESMEKWKSMIKRHIDKYIRTQWLHEPKPSLKYLNIKSLHVGETRQSWRTLPNYVRTLKRA